MSSSTSSNYSHSQTSPQSSDSTRSHLESLTRAWISLLNTRSFSELESFHSIIDHSRFQAHIGDNITITSYHQFLNTYRQLIQKSPAIQVNIIEVSSTIDEARGFADTYVYAEAPGQSGGIRKHGVSLVEWRRNAGDGRWLCTEYSILKGLEGVV